MTNDILLVEPMLDDYPAETIPGWTYDNFGHHLVVNGKFGQLEVGMVPGKSWDQWLFHENGGGGALVAGYSFIDGALHIMMLAADRFNLVGDADYELPGGFVDEDEAKLATAIREMLEDDEAGMLTNPTPVQGRGYVGNRAFFQLAGEHEGTAVFMFELAPDHLENIEASDGKLVLMSWQDAVRTTRDALSGHAIARVVADLL
ncbi:MAG: NUDIX domain-containing protein [Candidatus Saccharimonadales bacterium]